MKVMDRLTFVGNTPRQAAVFGAVFGLLFGIVAASRSDATFWGTLLWALSYAIASPYVFVLAFRRRERRIARRRD